jgi:hypothetical protein
MELLVDFNPKLLGSNPNSAVFFLISKFICFIFFLFLFILFYNLFYEASLNGEFHRPGFQDVKLWYEIDVSLNA